MYSDPENLSTLTQKHSFIPVSKCNVKKEILLIVRYRHDARTTTLDGYALVGRAGLQLAHREGQAQSANQFAARR